MPLILLGVIGGLLALELAVLTKKTCRSLVKLVVKMVPMADRPRWEEEWLRHMEDLQGAPILSLLWLVGLAVASIRMSIGSHIRHVSTAVREAKHMIRISRNLRIFRRLDWDAHALLCANAWRCTDDHQVTARKDVAYWKAVTSVIWWAVVTASVVFRPSVGIDRAVTRLTKVPQMEDLSITPVERRLH